MPQGDRIQTPTWTERMALFLFNQEALPDPIRLFLVGGLELASNWHQILFESPVTTNSHITRMIRLAQKPDSATFGATARPVAIVTGANTGCGYETTKGLLQAGYHVILACRNPDITQKAIDRLKQETDLDHMEFMELDLASLTSVAGFCNTFKAKGLPLHLLVNNAGIMMTPYARTAEGFESQFGVNYVGHFVLTMKLVDVLKHSAPARIINLTSNAHLSTRSIDTKRLEDPKAYDPRVNYAISKLANLLFTAELSRRLEGTGVTVNAAHPGPVATELYRHLPAAHLVSAAVRYMFLTPAQGALTTLHLALSPDVNGVSGMYFFNREPHRPSPAAENVENQKALWEYTVDKLAAKFPEAKEWA
ncbi:Retinol dehydrogenase 13 [Dimargaris verticillata]|uniref:Retinol dehydrogenase 13 n=1 Tax=Dimargaris verticillata TaxID=2761393 RepID=A0A9W8B5T1_9FUNG|nr:Retinol dehydrogenase 13 [Dimargaris verticillata]